MPKTKRRSISSRTSGSRWSASLPALPLRLGAGWAMPARSSRGERARPLKRWPPSRPPASASSATPPRSALPSKPPSAYSAARYPPSSFPLSGAILPVDVELNLASSVLPQQNRQARITYDLHNDSKVLGIYLDNRRCLWACDWGGTPNDRSEEGTRPARSAVRAHEGGASSVRGRAAAL